jgi:hypothetical protein
MSTRSIHAEFRGAKALTGTCARDLVLGGLLLLSVP